MGLRASSRGYEHGATVMEQNSVVYQSTKDDDSTINEKEKFKGPKYTYPLWTHTAAASQGQIPWTYPIYRTDMEGTAEKGE